MPTAADLEYRRMAISPSGDADPSDEKLASKIPQSSLLDVLKLNESSAKANKKRKSPEFTYTDILFEPHLLLDETLGEEYIKNNEANPLLQMCLDGGLKKPKKVKTLEARPISALLALCQEKTPFDGAALYKLNHVLDELEQNKPKQSQEYTEAIHILIKKSFGPKMFIGQAIEKIVKHCQTHPDNFLDTDGNSPLTAIGTHFCHSHKFSYVNPVNIDRVAHVAETLLKLGCSPNHLNKYNRTLLSYTVMYGDETVNLSRLLINHGAHISLFRSRCSFNEQDIVKNIQMEKESSAFNWLLQTVIEKQDLASTCETIHLLSKTMGQDPGQMKKHVQRLMIEKGININLGPLFEELLQMMAPYWTSPQSLKYLCLKKIRSTIGPKNMSDTRLNSLPIPKMTLEYIQLEN